MASSIAGNPGLWRIYECLPLLCPRCNRPMQILTFIQDPRVIEKILRHIGEPTQAPKNISEEDDSGPTVST
jgi:hypothetical protein